MQLFEILFAGLVGAALMTVVMGLIHKSGWANADMIRALGSMATGGLRHAVPVGMVMHAAAGMAFAVPYVALLSVFSTGARLETALVGGVVGLIHGIVVSYILMAVVSDRHPVEQFRKAGFEVAIAHIVGHVAYGVGVGATTAALGLRIAV